MRERERELSQKKRIALCVDWVGCSNYLIFFIPKKISEMGFGARRGVRENGLLVLIHGE